MKPGKDGYLPPYSCDALQNYVLSFGAAVLFTVLFGLITGVHIVQAFIYKKVYPASCSTYQLLSIDLTNCPTEILLGHHHGIYLGTCSFNPSCLPLKAPEQ